MTDVSSELSNKAQSDLKSSQIDKNLESKITELCVEGDDCKLIGILRELEVRQVNLYFENPIFCILGRTLQKVTQTKLNNYKSCFSALLNYPYLSKECINNVDTTGYCALHYAVQFKFDDIIYELLRQGAYVGILNSANDIAIKYIDADLFEKYLDSCVTRHNEDTPDYNITLNYSAFSCSTLPEDDFYFRYAEPTQVLKIITQSDKLKHLVNHPVIHHLVKTLWNDMMQFTFLNILLVILLFFQACFLTLNAHSDEALTEYSTYDFMQFCRYASYVLLVILSLREFFEFCVSKGACKSEYICSAMNWIECSFIIILSILLFCDLSQNDSLKRTLTSIEILLTAVEYNYICKNFSMSSISVYAHMFKTVTMNVFKLLLIYSIYILAFGYALFILFRKSSDSTENEKMNLTEIINVTSNDDFHTFENVIPSLTKLLVMLIGELDYDNIQLHRHKMSYIVFLLFIFFISIVLTNLLNGLAITDIQEIVENAERNRIMYCIKILERNERHLKLTFFDMFTTMCSYIESTVNLSIQRIFRLRLRSRKFMLNSGRINQIKIFPHVNKTKVEVLHVSNNGKINYDEVESNLIHENLLNMCLEIITKQNDERKGAMTDKDDKVINIISDVVALNDQIKEIIQELDKMSPYMPIK